MAAVEQDLHEYAVSADEALGNLAVGLAQEGADPAVVQTVQRMSAVMKRIIRALGPAPELAQPGPAEAAAPQGPVQEAAAERPAPMTIDDATRHLHQAMQAAAAARQGGQ